MQYYNVFGAFACPDSGECGCNAIPPNPCSPESNHMIASDFLCYSGPNLPGTGINTYDSLTVAIQKIDAQIVLIKSLLP